MGKTKFLNTNESESKLSYGQFTILKSKDHNLKSIKVCAWMLM